MTDKTITILEDDPLGTESIDETTEQVNEVEALEYEESQENDSVPGADSDLASLRAENAELAEQVKRISAEFQNFRRRQEEEAKRVKVRLREDIIRTMLPILDNLERTLEAARTSQDGAHEALLKGVELVEKDVKKIFNEHGLEAIAAEGEMFDAALHQAVMMQETDEVPDQTILRELQKGYSLGGRVIRPSMVQVARNS